MIADQHQDGGAIHKYEGNSDLARRLYSGQAREHHEGQEG